MGHIKLLCSFYDRSDGIFVFTILAKIKKKSSIGDQLMGQIDLYGVLGSRSFNFLSFLYLHI